MSEIEFSKRVDRVEIAIERLADVSADLNKLIAVHEQRLIQQERTMDHINTTIEKRREDCEEKFRDVYDTIYSQDKTNLTEINQEIAKFRTETQEQYKELTKKIGDIERIIWIYMGGFTVVTFLLMYGPTIYKLFTHVP